MKKLENVVARFVPPQRDKHWSFQIVFNKGELPHSSEFISLFKDPDVKKVEPFLQGHNGNWAMVEFWTHDEAAARKAAEKFAAKFKVEMKDGDFTRADIGLD
jgi:hypothetical protein